MSSKIKESSGGGLENQLKKDGLDPHCADEEKVRYLWNLYVKTEAALSASVTSVAELRRQQAEEMKEVENYVEHIRRLSNDHEALTLEFEAENESLKEEVERLKGQLSSYGGSEETREMLLQQGLDDIAEGSVSEQVAYLLVERARLMDELEAEQARNCVHTPEGPMTAEQLMSVFDGVSAEADLQLYTSQKVRSLEHELEELRKHLDERDADCAEDRGADEREALQQQVEALREELGNLDQQVKATNADLFTKMQDVEASDQRRLEAESQQKEAESRCQEAESRCQEAESRLEDAQKQVDVLQLQLQNLEKEHGEGEEELRVLEADFRQKEQEYEGLEVKVTERQTAAAGLEAQIQSSKEEHRKLLEKIEEQKSLLESLTSENENKHKAAETETKLQCELSTQKERVLHLLAENKTLNSQLAQLTSDLTAEKAAHKAEVEGRDTRLTNLRQEVDTQQTTIKQLQDSNSDLVREKAELEARLGEAEDETEQLKADFEQLAINHQLVSETLDKNRDRESSASDELETTLKALELERSRTQQLEATLKELDLEKQTSEVLKDKLKVVEDEHAGCQAKIIELETHVLKLESELKSGSVTLTTQTEYQKEIEASLRRQLSDLQENTERMRRERDELVASTEAQKRIIATLRTENQLTDERVELLEKSADEAKREAREAQARVRELEEDLHVKESQLLRETSQNKERQEKNNRQLDDVSLSVDTLRLEVKKVNSELLKKEDEIRRLQADKSSAERSRHQLEQELTELRRLHAAELSAARERLSSTEERLAGTGAEAEALRRENTEVRGRLRTAEQELSSLKYENERVTAKSETQLTTEKRLHDDAQRRIATLTDDSQKAWSKVQELSAQLTRLQAENERLEGQLDNKPSEVSSFSGVQSEQTVVALQSAQKRAQEAENRLREAELSLASAEMRLQTTDNKEAEIGALRKQVSDQRDEIVSLKNEIHDERLKRSADDPGSQHQQILRVRDRERELQRKNTELQHLLLDVEAKTEKMRMEVTQATNVRNHLETRLASLQTQVSSLQQDSAMLQAELVRKNDLLELQCQKYAERKIRTKHKFQRAREMFVSERSRLEQQVSSLEGDVGRLRDDLAAEATWREKMEEEQRKLAFEKRNLLAQLTEVEEQQRDGGRSLALLQVKASFLEEENASLQQRVDSLSRQKHNLDRLVKEYQLERHRQCEVHEDDGKPEDLAKNLPVELSAILTPRAHTYSHLTAPATHHCTTNGHLSEDEDEYASPAPVNGSSRAVNGSGRAVSELSDEQNGGDEFGSADLAMNLHESDQHISGAGRRNLIGSGRDLGSTGDLEINNSFDEEEAEDENMRPIEV